jgi:hypothetical protein
MQLVRTSPNEAKTTAIGEKKTEQRKTFLQLGLFSESKTRNRLLITVEFQASAQKLCCLGNLPERGHCLHSISGEAGIPAHREGLGIPKKN